MTKNIRRMVRRKVKVHRAARKSKQWSECKKNIKKKQEAISQSETVCEQHHN
jgi:hypothetical protein